MWVWVCMDMWVCRVVGVWVWVDVCMRGCVGTWMCGCGWVGWGMLHVQLGKSATSMVSLSMYSQEDGTSWGDQDGGVGGHAWEGR